MKIKDFMITDVISVTEKTTIRDLLQILVENKIGGVPVLDDDRKLVGVISDGDVIRYLQPKARTVYDMFSLVLVSEEEALTDKMERTLDETITCIMKKKNILSVHPEERLEDALSILSKYHFKKIPVIDNTNTVVGVISRGDLIRYISNRLLANNA
ncbi:CBS domain-containing protein [Ornithinibacillus halophilus]|uniref:CBS domain-containing protein n=1 Tax=Ornithinibacillus halophilus TaxID=930117 RepID=A0A1M5CIM7_9BACI|nr:CBS domain-containing protein [Ornithinibacillus halophilus]SHF54457.1 CBS domain-containing protein [Ornithinibacillus halophilus]